MVVVLLNIWTVYLDNRLLNLLEFDKKKVEAELSSRNIFRKKHKKRDDLREKWCYYGLKKRPNEQNDDFDEK